MPINSFYIFCSNKLILYLALGYPHLRKMGLDALNSVIGKPAYGAGGIVEQCEQSDLEKSGLRLNMGL